MNQSLTQANFNTSIRYLLTTGISFAAGKGWITTDTATNLGILAVALIPMAWGLYTNFVNKQAAEEQVTTAVRATAAMAIDPNVAVPPPHLIGAPEAKAIVAAYPPPAK